MKIKLTIPITCLALTSLCQLATADDTSAQYKKLITEDKGLDPTWLASLTERGHVLDAGITGSKKDDSLKFIGMPVGGIACGTLVMDGAGQLYSWDIFGGKPEGIVKQDVKLPEGYIGFKNGLRKTIRVLDGANYMNPPTVEKFPAPLDQGFAIRFKDGTVRVLADKDWQAVNFKGQWPIGEVTYQDPKSPVEVTLSAFSPFIPLNVEDSKLPVTVRNYRIKNNSSSAITIDVLGWLGAPKKAKLLSDKPNLVARKDSSSLVYLMEYPQKGRKKSINKEGSLVLSYLGKAEQIDHSGTPGLKTSISLAAGETHECSFLISWHFGQDAYTPKFKNAEAVSDYVVENFDRLSTDTQQWVDTWNDSTLPQWFLDRAMAPTSTLQTANLQYAGERFWSYEGIGAGPGTCTHVWAYAQAMGRLFPSLEQNLREQTDFAKGRNSQLPDGGVPFRPSKNAHIAIDGQCGTVLRSYRGHLVSPDAEFLKRNWPAIKKSMNYLIEFDKNDDAYDGLLDGEQHNTLDAEWFGKVHVLCSLYLAALRASEEMAIEMGDKEFTKLCRDTFEMGSKNIDKLYNGEHYIQIEDPAHADAIGVGPGVYIDQVYGQFWADQVGLGQLHNKEHIRSSLKAIWKYNYISDMGPFREVFRKGRFYAWKGDGGLIMCSWPNGGIKETQREFWTFGYFNEVMSGFEHQVAAHMIGEGDPDLLQKGLAVMRTVHDRYAPSKRNPYNEIEFSDFYARAMAAYGSLITICGFDYNGPAGMIGFNPVLHAEDFRAPFTVAEGWGTYSQKVSGKEITASLKLTWGSLSLKTLNLNPKGLDVTKVEVTLKGSKVDATMKKTESGVSVELSSLQTIETGDELIVKFN